MSDWRAITRTVPSGLHAKKLCHGSHFASHTQTADLGKMNAYVVNQAVSNQRNILMLGIEEFTHCQRRTALLPQQSEVVIFLGWQRVFQKKEPIPFQFFAQANRLMG